VDLGRLTRQVTPDKHPPVTVMRRSLPGPYWSPCSGEPAPTVRYLMRTLLRCPRSNNGPTCLRPTSSQPQLPVQCWKSPRMLIGSLTAASGTVTFGEDRG